MPIKIQSDLPVKEILEKENIFVMDESRASHQDIRPIQILILNLMPLKEETELQLLRSLSNTPLQVDVTFMAVQSHEAKTRTPTISNSQLRLFSVEPSPVLMVKVILSLSMSTKGGSSLPLASVWPS